MKSLVCRRLEKMDNEQLSDLQMKVFGRKRDEKYWDWKYFQNPAGEHAMYVAVDPESNTIVGEHGTIPMRMRAGEREITSAQGVDIAILQEYQKGGPFFQLHQHATEEASSRAELTYAFSIKKTFRIFTRLLHFKGVCPVCSYIKILDPTPFIRWRIKSKLIAGLCGGLGKMIINLRNQGKPVVPDGLELYEIQHFDHRFDEFWQGNAEKYDIMIIRDSQYLNWRYIKNPETTYKIFALGEVEGGAIKGYIVLATVEGEIKKGYIVDILVEKRGDEWAKMLLLQAAHYFLGERVDSFSGWMQEDSTLTSAFKEMDVRVHDTPYDLMICPYSSEIPVEYFLDKSKWYITIGDSDFI